MLSSRSLFVIEGSNIPAKKRIARTNDLVADNPSFKNKSQTIKGQVKRTIQAQVCSLNSVAAASWTQALLPSYRAFIYSICQ
jgi:hypothetical protein